MSYPTKYRERTIEYRQEGHTLEETKQVFHVAISTIRDWEKQLQEEGQLEKKPVERSFRKIDPEKLRSYVENHPDAYQSEMVKEFHCSESGIHDALRRLGITRKKDNSLSGTGRGESSGLSGEDQGYTTRKNSVCG